MFTIAGDEYVLFTQEAAAYPTRGLDAVVADLTPHSAAIVDALDRLTG
jgi:hypothetical protein